MRLGTRWTAGSTPPPGVPDSLHGTLAEVEAAATGPTGSWTLTWLEGRPVATHDDGTVVTLVDGVAAVTRTGDEPDDSDGPVGSDDW